MELQPQRGAIARIFAGSSPSVFQPLLEVKNIRKLQQDTETRYAVSVTDGEFVVKALAIPGSTLIGQVESGTVCVNTLIKLADYRLEDLNGTSFLLIMTTEIIGVVPQHLRVAMDAIQRFPGAKAAAGAESGAAPADPAAAAAAPAQAQAPPWAAQSGAFTTPERRAAPASFAEQTPMPQPMGLRGSGAPGVNPYGGPSEVCAPPGGCLPISELSPYTNGRWRIKARVISKSDIRRFSNARGEGQLFKVDLVDKSGETSATFFGKAVDVFYPQLRQGQVYTFTKGHIKQGNPRWDRSEYVLTFEESATIEAVEEDRELPGVTYDFKPLCMVQELEVNSHIDVQAVVYAVQEPFTFISKNTNKEMVKREIGLWDPSGPEGASFSNLTLWGDRALNETFEAGTPIFIKGARVQEFNGQKDLSSPAVMEANPDDPRAFALKAKYEEHQRTRPLPISMSRSGQSSAGSRKTIRGCREEDLQLGPPLAPGQGFDPNGPRSVHRHFALATVTSLPAERMPCYPSCPALVDSSRPMGMGATQAQGGDKRTCNKKVTNEGPNIWRCAAGHMCQQPVFRYLCKVQVMDHTDSVEVNVYDNVAKLFFGCDAGEYARLYESPEQERDLQRVNGRVLWRRVLLKLRSQKEIWQESERVRYNVDEASAVTIAKEARTLLAEVKRSLAAEQ